jgi:hypothetical protein
MSRPTIGGDDDSKEESDMGMDVDTIQEHSSTEELASDPSTNFLVPGIYASEMVEDSWTLTDHLSFDREINDGFPLSVGRYRDNVLPNLLAAIADQNKKKLPLKEASELIKDYTWLRDLLIACRTKGSFRDIRRLSECLLYTFPVKIVS